MNTNLVEAKNAVEKAKLELKRANDNLEKAIVESDAIHNPTHGDYGFNEFNEKRIFIRVEDKIAVFNEYGRMVNRSIENVWTVHPRNCYTVRGNVFKDCFKK